MPSVNSIDIEPVASAVEAPRNDEERRVRFWFYEPFDHINYLPAFTDDLGYHYPWLLCEEATEYFSPIQTFPLTDAPGGTGYIPFIGGSGYLVSGVTGSSAGVYRVPATPTPIIFPSGVSSTAVVKGRTMVISDVYDDVDETAATVKGAETSWANVEQRLAVVEDVNVNVTTKTTLFTHTSGDPDIVITKVVILDATVNLDTAVAGFGWNANADDVFAAAALAKVTTGAYVIWQVNGATTALGTGTASFGIKCTTAQGAAATVTVEVWGYYR